MAKKKGKDKSQDRPSSIVNRRARYDYEFISTYEAGIALVGSEVKSVFLGRVNMTDAYCMIRQGELYLMNLDIEPYEHAGNYRPERRRDRKLLMHRKEIELLGRKSQEKGLTMIPSKLYFKNGKVKVEVALARGKAKYEKRDKIEKKDTRREIENLRSGKF